MTDEVANKEIDKPKIIVQNPICPVGTGFPDGPQILLYYRTVEDARPYYLIRIGFVGERITFPSELHKIRGQMISAPTMQIEIVHYVSASQTHTYSLLLLTFGIHPDKPEFA